MVKKDWYIKFGLLLVLTFSVFNAASCQEGKQLQEGKEPIVNYSEVENQMIRYIKDGDYDLAIESAKRYLENNPNNVVILNVLGNAYFAKGEISSAEETLKRALEIEPNNSSSKRLEEQIAEQKRALTEQENLKKE